MGDDTAAKLAAGRKMLKDFQVRKKTVPQKESIIPSSTQTPSDKGQTEHVHPGYHNNSNGVIQNQAPPLASAGVQPTYTYTNDNQANFFQTPQYNGNNQNAGIGFFDQISSYQNQNNQAASDLSLPAEQFISNHSNNPAPHPPDQPLYPYQHDQIESNTEPEQVHDANDIKLLVENSKLQQKLQYHMQTVEFLVSEKNELNSKIFEQERAINDLKTQVDDVTGRLNISRHRASHLEVECSDLKQKHQETDARLTQASQDLRRHQTVESLLNNAKTKVEEELQEVKAIMHTKVTECKELQRNVDELKFHINASELRFQQLSQGQVRVDSSENQNMREQYANLEQQVKYLTQQLAEAEAEKNQSNVQYQQYVQQLNTQIESMGEKQEELLSENENLSNREMNLVRQMGALEKQLQSLQSRNTQSAMEPKSTAPVTAEADVTALRENLQKLETEKETLMAELHKKQQSLETAQAELAFSHNQMEELSTSLKLLQSERPDAAKLHAANESDRLAAQKATAQNAKMKLNLEQLEEAFGQMTNSKLELAELLQAEKNLTKMLSLKLAENEENYRDTHSKLLAKDEEMIRLQAASSELQKENLKHAQIADRLSHYEAQGQSSDVLQAELESARYRLSVLTTENERLRKLTDHKENQDSNHNSEAENDPSNSLPVENGQEIVKIPTEEAMYKLQEKFTKLIKEVAELSDEKQRLEHLVLQLQGETETICEYITLYQKQRGILKQRESEKDVQLNLLTQERQHMKEQLDQLNRLIQELVVSGNTKAIDSQQSSIEKPKSKEQLETADKIMELLSEIKTSHLIEPGNNCANFGSFHSCAWCSGKLIDV